MSEQFTKFDINKLTKQRDNLLDGCLKAHRLFAEGKTIVELMMVIDQTIAQFANTLAKESR